MTDSTSRAPHSSPDRAATDDAAATDADLAAAYDYELPPHLIAQRPVSPRDHARLMRLNRATGAVSHERFDALPSLLQPGDLLVFNDTRVLRARLRGYKVNVETRNAETQPKSENAPNAAHEYSCNGFSNGFPPQADVTISADALSQADALGLSTDSHGAEARSADSHSAEVRNAEVDSAAAPLAAALLAETSGRGGRVEALLLRELASGLWEALLKPSARLRPGTRLCFESRDGRTRIFAVPVERTQAGWTVRFEGDLRPFLPRIGEVPLPPYIEAALQDEAHYQTVFARGQNNIAFTRRDGAANDDIDSNLGSAVDDAVFNHHHAPEPSHMSTHAAQSARDEARNRDKRNRDKRNRDDESNDAPHDLEAHQSESREREARKLESAAAPTAGLHFTSRTFDELHARGIATAFVTLQIGIGTFRPMKADSLDEHTMHEEEYEIPLATQGLIARQRALGRRVIAVGTTTTRVLEAASDGRGGVFAGPGRTEIFIRPGYGFGVVDALLTNFHLPRSSLLVMIAAFAADSFARNRKEDDSIEADLEIGQAEKPSMSGLQKIRYAYSRAVAEEYRFFSFGDAMLIE